MKNFWSRFAGGMLVLAAVTAGPAGGAVRVAVSPETLTVAPGASFTLELRVPVAGSAFNGYDAIVEYDTTALTFLPTNPPGNSNQQLGTDMFLACGNTFHLFKRAADSLSISHVLLCADLSLTGPALLYRLNFHASNTPGATRVRLRRAQFFDGGTFVNPALKSDAWITWGGPLAAGDPPPVSGIRLAVRGNPSRGDQWFDLASPSEGLQRLVVHDVAGRALRHLEDGRQAAGTRAVRWDGRDDDGRTVPPGIYLVHFFAAGRSARASLVRLP